MQGNVQCLSQSNKGSSTIVDKAELDSLNKLNGGVQLYPVCDILTTEFKGIQVLHFIEEKMSLYDLFKSLIMGPIDGGTTSS